MLHKSREECYVIALLLPHCGTQTMILYDLLPRLVLETLQKSTTLPARPMRRLKIIAFFSTIWGPCTHLRLWKAPIRLVHIVACSIFVHSKGLHITDPPHLLECQLLFWFSNIYPWQWQSCIHPSAPTNPSRLHDYYITITRLHNVMS